jgi:hypothetical protein
MIVQYSENPFFSMILFSMFYSGCLAANLLLFQNAKWDISKFKLFGKVIRYK